MDSTLRWEIVNTLTVFPNQQAATALALASVLLGVLLLWGLQRWNKRQALKQRGLTMPRGDRQRYLRTVIGEGVVDLVEGLVIKGKINSQEARRQYHLLATYMDNEDLRPRKVHPRAVVNRLKKLIAERKDNPIPAPDIPGPRPGETTSVPKDTNVIQFGQKALSRKRQVA